MKPWHWVWIGGLLSVSLVVVSGCTAQQGPPAPIGDVRLAPVDVNAAAETTSIEITADEIPVGNDAVIESARALTVEQVRILQGLKEYGPAPELTNETWLNSPPLPLADLRGNVVIVEFWTYG